MNTTRSRWMIITLLAALFAGCGGGGGGGTQQDAKLSIAYSALTAKVGDAVTLTAHLENATSAVNWSLSGPGALSATAGNEIAFQAQATGTASVTAAAAGLTASVVIKVVPGGNPGPTTGTITGLVLNQNGYPIVNQAVFVVNDPTTLTHTDTTGHFTIAGVTPPYDLAMVQDASTLVYVYRGLTRSDPTLYVYTQADQTNFPPRLTTLTGATAGGDGAPVAGEIRRIGFVSPDVNEPVNVANSIADIPAIPGPYTLNVAWNGALVTTGTLVAFEIHPDTNTGAPLNYWYAAQPDVTLLGGQVLTGPTMTLMPVATANTQGTITLAPLYQLVEKTLALTFENGVFFPIFTDIVSLAQPNFKYVAPAINAATTEVCAEAVNTVALQPGASITCVDALAPATPNATINILAAPQPFAPANGANAVGLATTFAWSDFTGGVFLVRITPAAGQNAPTYFIFTAGTSTTIPNLSTVGLAFTPGRFNWDVTGFAPFASLDAFTAGIPAGAVFLKQGLTPPVPNSSVGRGQQYTFNP